MSFGKTEVVLKDPIFTALYLLKLHLRNLAHTDI